MYMSVNVPADIRMNLSIERVDKLPNEACAMLFGEKDRVSKAILCTNVKPSPGYFEMDDAEVMKNLSDTHERFIGIWHSHPTGFETPSGTDYGYMQTVGGVWIIQTERTFRGFILDEGHIREVGVQQ